MIFNKFLLVVHIIFNRLLVVFVDKYLASYCIIYKQLENYTNKIKKLLKLFFLYDTIIYV